MLLNHNQVDLPKDTTEAAAIKVRLWSKYKLDAISDEIENIIGIPEVGYSVMFWTGARWSMHHLVHYLLKHIGSAQLILSTYTLSEEALRLLKELRNAGQITGIQCLIDKRFAIRSPKAQQLAKGLFDDYTLYDCHAKVTILQNEAWNISIVGSANWSENKRYESGVIFYDYEVTHFWKHKLLEAIQDERINRGRF